MGKYLSVIKKVVPLHCKCGSSSVGRASAFQAECREFEPRLPLDHMNKFKIVISGSSSVGRASAFQAECREFEPRLPLKSLTVVRLFLL